MVSDQICGSSKNKSEPELVVTLVIEYGKYFGIGTSLVIQKHIIFYYHYH